jgi:hypothetical protein
LEHADHRTLEPRRRGRLRSLPDLQLGPEATATLLASQHAVVTAANEKRSVSRADLSPSPNVAQPRAFSHLNSSAPSSTDAPLTPTSNGGNLLRLRPRAGSLPAVTRSPNNMSTSPAAAAAATTPVNGINGIIPSHGNGPQSPDSLATPSPLSSAAASPGGIELHGSPLTSPLPPVHGAAHDQQQQQQHEDPGSARGGGLRLVSDTMSVIAEESSRDATPLSSHRSPARSTGGHSSHGSFGSSMSASSPMAGASWPSTGGGSFTTGSGNLISSGGGSGPGAIARLHGRSPSGSERHGSFHASLSPGPLPTISRLSPERPLDRLVSRTGGGHRGSIDSNSGSSSSTGSSSQHGTPVRLSTSVGVTTTPTNHSIISVAGELPPPSMLPAA